MKGWLLKKVSYEEGYRPRFEVFATEDEAQVAAGKWVQKEAQRYKLDAYQLAQSHPLFFIREADMTREINEREAEIYKHRYDIDVQKSRLRSALKILQEE